MVFAKLVLAIAAPYFIGAITILMLLNVYTAVAWVGFLVAFTLLGLRYHFRHHRPNRYDDRRWKNE